ncbi:baseplate J/gp47 family protein [Pseudochryseolinea flava]|uniref:Baseplate protein J-like domain-containing protein n=1 Tax=Pseudochryseolinea flava TaxID=2059302 RepID=A0A364Y4C1_9BACT|nr:baseplate J/gp47 family protein [Pseudochryseolinea flava]RAW01589.1 hypothetical protein DQQ10_07985 [Pseudochryseolinea flava]
MSCFHPNPLQHGGSSQDLRMVPALSPETAPIDGRGMDALILFLEKYGELLNYYDSSNTIQGNWRPFVGRDISTILAGIAVNDFKNCLAVYYKYFDKIQVWDGDLQQHTKVLFDISFTLIDNVRDWFDRLPPNTAAKEMILREIDTALSYNLRDLVLYYLAAKKTYIPAHDFIDVSFTLAAGTEPFVPRDSEQILQTKFQAHWWKKFNQADVISSWNFYRDTYLPANLTSVTLFGDLAWSDEDGIQYASSSLRNLFTSIYNTYVRIITSAKSYFQESITNLSSHSAHNGLILSFLHLFGHSQRELNRLTDRHLNFYYKDVLRIKRRPPNPDIAHIVLTLAKNVSPQIIPIGTALLGKDGKGKELIFKTDGNITVQRCSIGALKTVFLDEDPASGGVWYADVANSADGMGKDLPPTDLSWFGFGSKQSVLSDDAKTMTEADLGFMVASPILTLSEGKRVVTLTLHVASFGSSVFAAGDLVGKLDLSITGEKGWIQLPALSSSSPSTQPNAVNIASNNIVLKFTIDETADAVVAYDPELHEGNYATSAPVVRALFKKTNDVSLYKKLAKVTISHIHIGVSVDNAVSCVLHSDQGSIDNKNPFMPFGPRPKKGSVFYFGSHEVFSKKLTSLTLKLSWLGTPADTTFYDYYAYLKGSTETSYIGLSNSSSSSSFSITGMVKDGVEVANNPSPTTLFSGGDDSAIVAERNIVFSNLFTESDPSMDEFTAFDPALRRGFVKLTLATPTKAFGHHVFSKIYTEQVIGFNATTNTLPNEPYTPLLNPLTFAYQAEETIVLGAGNDNSKGQFFQLFPFGHSEQNLGVASLMLPFTALDKTNSLHDLQGALHIGLSDAKPGEMINLYIECSEGSEDAALDAPKAIISYLSNNAWRSIDDSIYVDTTNNFLGSGILQFKVPPDMNDDNTIMSSSMRWLRIGVPNNYTAFPKLYAIFSNGVKTVYTGGADNGEHLAMPLVAQSINKLQVSLAEIKKVEQPFDSTDGRMIEGDQRYYTRVSERLRHKHRAITIWDYEKILLEEFSYLYKVKCLNHTDDVTETAPGAVRIITIPDMSKKSTGNLFMPMISNNKRQKIKSYVTKLNCPFADLQVQNPQYEAIKVKCEVKIKAGLDETAHIQMLKEDIDRFLAPWAFEEGRGIDFGGKMHRSQIIYFMEKLSYVDYVTDFLMDVYVNGIADTDLEEVKASTSRSILTTYRNHQIGTNVCAS